ncbi:hypothetical protein [Carboxylicivirga linearis]|uniref:SLATT domain-containing protein n=1 Tax=Carboxylicivirga linearis TaxID=1628157 RepID=A0ABS5K3C2_9BACT|nr:hypothetical protein [Carboxylicivirga linearis]MBS2101086.1 hypothetical protein [Carboxylicivirga linearis]
MRNRIWTELTQAKHNTEFATLYSDRQRVVLRMFNIGVLAFSSAGIMGWKVWEHLPIVACAIIAAISLLRLLQPQIIMNEKQLKNLDDIHRFYADYFNEIEKLWFDYESNRLSEEQATERFFELKKQETDINPLIAETIRSKPKGIVSRCKLHSDNYFKQVFNI